MDTIGSRWLSSAGQRKQDRGYPVFRAVLILTQAATILATWPLWQVRDTPPMLPAVPLPQWDLGLLLLASLAVIAVAPRTGVILHAVLVGIAMCLDQMRMQPPIISQVLLLWSTLPVRSAAVIGRAHLLALWFYAGAYKLLSPDYLDGDPRWLLRELYPAATDFMCVVFGLGAACTEIALAVGAWCRKTRHLVGPLAYAFHLGILVSLSPAGIGWDPGVWAWNFALAVSGLILISGWNTRMLDDLSAAPLPVHAVAVVLLVTPLGYSFGVIDTCFCHLLYSNHVPLARVHTPESINLIDTRPQLNVPVPQVQRLYRSYFAAVAGAEDRLEIRDPRWWYRRSGQETRWYDLPHAASSPLEPRQAGASSPGLLGN